MKRVSIIIGCALMVLLLSGFKVRQDPTWQFEGNQNASTNQTVSFNRYYERIFVAFDKETSGSVDVHFCVPEWHTQGVEVYTVDLTSTDRTLVAENPAPIDYVIFDSGDAFNATVYVIDLTMPK